MSAYYRALLPCLVPCLVPCLARLRWRCIRLCSLFMPHVGLLCHNHGLAGGLEQNEFIRPSPKKTPKKKHRSKHSSLSPLTSYLFFSNRDARFPWFLSRSRPPDCLPFCRARYCVEHTPAPQTDPIPGGDGFAQYVSCNSDEVDGTVPCQL